MSSQHRRGRQASKQRLKSFNDSEAARVFRGFKQNFDQIERTHLDDDAPAPTTTEPTTAAKTFDGVRKALQALRANDFATVVQTLADLMRLPNLLNIVRTCLVPAAVAAQRLHHELAPNQLPDAPTVRLIEERLSEAVGLVAQAGSGPADEVFDLSMLGTIELPDLIDAPTLVDNIPMLVLTQTGLRRSPDVRCLSPGIYLLRATLVGVPRLGKPDAWLDAANTAALAQRGGHPCPLPLTRPDSGAVWYALFKQRIVAEVVQFPDQVRRVVGAAVSSATAAMQAEAQQARVRERRMQFEQDHRNLLERLALAEDVARTCDVDAREYTVKFKDTYKQDPNTPAVKLKAAIEKDRAAELKLCGTNIARRFETNQRFNNLCRAMLRDQDRIFELRLRSRLGVKEVKKLRQDLDTARTRALNPMAGVIQYGASRAA